MNVHVKRARWGYTYAAELPLIGGPRHGQTQLFNLVSMPIAGALTGDYRFCETLADGTTRWDVYSVQRNDGHEPVAFVHDHSFIYDRNVKHWAKT